MMKDKQASEITEENTAKGKVLAAKINTVLAEGFQQLDRSVSPNRYVRALLVGGVAMLLLLFNFLTLTCR